MADQGSLSIYTSRKVLAHLTGHAAWTPPAQIFVGLFTTVPTDTVPGLFVQDAGLKPVQWQEPTQGPIVSISNSTSVTFGPATADWGTLLAFGLFDSASGAANNIAYGEIDIPTPIGIGESYVFNSGAIIITSD